MSTHCLISFGSNLGDRDRVIAQAARFIAESGVISPHGCDDLLSPETESISTSPGLHTSRLFETPPIGGPGGQSPFLNAVAAFATQKPAAEVLDVLQQTEVELGRERHDRWGARSIDLDVVLHGELCGEPTKAGRRGLIGGRGPAGSAMALVVPHPRYTARRFVVTPACDVAGDFCDPRFGWSIADLAQHLDADVPSMALAGGDESMRLLICERLHREHGVQIIDAEAIIDRGDRPNDFATDQPWVSPTVPRVLLRPDDDTHTSTPTKGLIGLPRLLTRIQRTTEETRWPAPHQIWPSGWRWPEYRLEVDDLNWAVGEIASALDSMKCPLKPTTSDGNWWK